MMIKELLLVGAGSCLGGVGRYLISLLMRSSSGAFPWGTFTVNIVGSLLIGLLWGWTCRCPQVSPWVSLFLMVGFCGGFTTFSTFSKESLMLFQAGHYATFLLYVLGSFMLGLLAVLAGYLLTAHGLQK